MWFECEIAVPRHLSKKNNRPVYRGRPGKSSRLLSMEKYLDIMLLKAKQEHKLKNPLPPPYHVTFTFVFGKDRSRELKLCDLSNLIELPQDALQSAGIIENDRFIQSLDGTRKVPGPKTVLKIRIQSYTEQLGGKKDGSDW